MRPVRSAALLFLALLVAGTAFAAGSGRERFKQLDEVLPTPTEVRIASGAPGPAYWQQQVDYEIRAELDEAKQRITGAEQIRYTNNSPHTLPYLWMQLDQNRFRKDSEANRIETTSGFDEFPYRALANLLAREEFEGGYDIQGVVGADGKTIPHAIIGTMMRLDLPEPLRPGRQIRFEVRWAHNIVDAKKMWARGGYETLDDGNRIFTIAQWFPRMAAYNDVSGWQNKQFLGRGEFALELGDYRVRLTVPGDHVVSATGTLSNPRKVLTRAQRDRLKEARRSTDKTVYVVTPDEAKAAREKAKDGLNTDAGKKTWVFEADNVRDFAFATSRTFIWDAMAVPLNGKTVMAMSYFPPEADPLWSQYSTHAVAHTIEVFSRMTFDYPYPQASSINGPVGGMEYPMVCFNGPRAEEDGTYYDTGGKEKNWWRSKYGLISVIIHEVGHNWFPMIVNSDERQWTWMDEGLNTFLQFVTEQEWEEDYPSWRGHPESIVGYMTSHNQVPIMSNSESLLQFGNNAYGKPATALNILRETVLGRENFDYAFKTYAQRWRFKRPMPADLFRTMEDASGVDLDWFWRGWFYTTDHVDIGISKVTKYTMDTRDPDVDKPAKKAEREAEPRTRTKMRTEADVEAGRLTWRVDRFPDLKDFYNTYDPDDVTEKDREDFKKMLEDLEPDERELLSTRRHFYVVDFVNEGGLPMPLPLRITYEGGEIEDLMIPAEIWRLDAERVSRLFMTRQPVASFELDRHDEIADADESDNTWPREPVESRFQLFKKKRPDNAMKAAKKAEEAAKKKKEEAAKEKAAEKKSVEDKK